LEFLQNIRSISPACLFAWLKPSVRITPSGLIGTVPGSRRTLRDSDDATPRTIRRQEGKNHFSVVVSVINESRPPRFTNRKRRQA
jgi:hypothetical protein